MVQYQQVRSCCLELALPAPAPGSAAPEDVVVVSDARHRPVAGGVEVGAGPVVSKTLARSVIVAALHVIANEGEAVCE